MLLCRVEDKGKDGSIGCVYRLHLTFYLCHPPYICQLSEHPNVIRKKICLQLVSLPV